GVAGGDRLAALCALPVPGEDGSLDLLAVLAGEAGLSLGSSRIEGRRYPSITAVCPQAHWFERAIAEKWGVVPDGHPWLKPIRFHRSWRPGSDAWGRPEGDPIVPGDAAMFRMEGSGIHEVAVGPVHAGV